LRQLTLAAHRFGQRPAATPAEVAFASMRLGGRTELVARFSAIPASAGSIDQSRTQSEKPAAFRELIDRLYDDGAGQELELFGRRHAEGWTVVGNELPPVRPDAAVREARR
jgi:hypothetical protein